MNSYENYYDDFVIGDLINHPLEKTISSGEHQLFTLLTMNHHLSHISSKKAVDSEFGKILVNGTYVLSLIVGITVPDVSFNAVANLGYESVKHVAPVFEGDTLRAETRIVGKRLSKSRDGYGLVEVETYGFRGKEVVLKLTRNILIKCHA